LQYAVRCGFDIVRTYADNGKSGLRLDGRDALKQLLIDVEGGSQGFKAVLVYDRHHQDRTLGGSVARDGPKGLITINGEFTGSIVIARCLSTRGGGAMRWNVRLDTALRPDITIAVRLAPDNEQPMDYYLLPHIDIKASRLRIAQRNAIFLDAYRSDTLHRFFQISARTRLGSAE
jgi:hypothetical protein